MGKCNDAAKGGEDALKSASLTPSFHRGEAGDPGDAVQDLRDEGFIAGRNVIGASPKMPF